MSLDNRGLTEKEVKLILVGNPIAITDAYVVDGPEVGYTLEIVIGGQRKCITKDRARFECRVFKSIDACVRLARSFGLRGDIKVSA